MSNKNQGIKRKKKKRRRSNAVNLKKVFLKNKNKKIVEACCQGPGKRKKKWNITL